MCRETGSDIVVRVEALMYGIGPQTKVMRKAKMSFQSGQVKQVIKAYAIEVMTGDKKDLDEEAVTLKLRKAMGANCKSKYSSGRGLSEGVA